MAERILVTGAAGFIGSHVCDALREGGHDVRAFDVSQSKYHDTKQLELVRSAVDGCAGIIHLAAVSRERAGMESPLRCIETNVMGTVNVLEAARLSHSKPWVILASTRDVPSDTYVARSLYGASWLSAEIIARRYAEDYGLRVLALRLSDVYGSNRDHQNRLLPNLVRLIMEGTSVATYNAAGRLFDFTYYTDVQRAFLLGIDWLCKAKSGCFEAVTICTGRGTSADGLALFIMSRASKFVRVVSMQRGGTTRTYDGDELRSNIGEYPTECIFNDTRAARELLGFETQVALKVGIDRMIALYREQVKI